jgi:hypothetical protein
MGIHSEAIADVVNCGSGQSFASTTFLPTILHSQFHVGYPLGMAYKDLENIKKYIKELQHSDDRIPQSDNRTQHSDDRIPQSDNRIPQSDDRKPHSDDRIPQSELLSHYPIVDATDRLFKEAISQGYESEDKGALMKVTEKKHGVLFRSYGEKEEAKW